MCAFILGEPFHGTILTWRQDAGTGAMGRAARSSSRAGPSSGARRQRRRHNSRQGSSCALDWIGLDWIGSI